MKFPLFLLNLFLISLIVFFSAQEVSAQKAKIYYAYIQDDIDLGLVPHIKRVITEAEKNNAAAIIFEINTFGGRVDAATQLKDLILDSKVLTIAYVNKRAISAGALITLSCKKIAMAKGASIGATTVVDQTGQKQGEKYQSYMRSEMRSTAERNGRRTDVAEGMVDETVIVDSLDDDKKLITLTSEEAVKYGVCDTIIDRKGAIPAAFGFKDYQFVYLETNWAEKVVRFLNNPIISSLLIMIGLVGMFTEIKTPGWGLPGTAALIALTLFFGSSYILELASIMEILIFVTGVVLLIVEIFVIPGFGIAGILGILLIIGSIFFSLLNTEFYFVDNLLYSAIIQLAGSLVTGILIFAIIFRYLPKSRNFSKLVLADQLEGHDNTSTSKIENVLMGATGNTITPLRPAGNIMIEGSRYDVVTEGDYIDKGEKVVVTHIEGSKIVVKKAPAEG
ncbi:MAG: nodulation protein NfeD [Ignavibacteriaceae bacterium]|nr:nodulation protein NfeD [Ignavibacteriaceae bacterium]